MVNTLFVTYQVSPDFTATSYVEFPTGNTFWIFQIKSSPSSVIVTLLSALLENVTEELSVVFIIFISDTVLSVFIDAKWISALGWCRWNRW